MSASLGSDVLMSLKSQVPLCDITSFHGPRWSWLRVCQDPDAFVQDFVAAFATDDAQLDKGYRDQRIQGLSVQRLDLVEQLEFNQK